MDGSAELKGKLYQNLFIFLDVQRKEVLLSLETRSIYTKESCKMFFVGYQSPDYHHLPAAGGRLQDEISSGSSSQRLLFFYGEMKEMRGGKGETGTIAVVLFWNGAPLRHHCRPGQFDRSYFLL